MKELFEILVKKRTSVLIVLLAIFVAMVVTYLLSRLKNRFIKFIPAFILIIVGTVNDALSSIKTWSITSFGRIPVKNNAYHQLPVHAVTNAKCYLDWIMPAAATSRSMQEFWNLASDIPMYEEDAIEKDTSFSLHVIARNHLLSSF